MLEQYLPVGWKLGDETHQFRLPTYVNVSAKVVKALNLNVYRNLHHFHLNNQKQTFHEQVKASLAGLPKFEKICLHYQIFAPTKARLDTMNVGSIVDKYFSDTLVEAKKIFDDNYNHVVFVSFSFGGVAPMDAHAIVTIHPLEKDQEMRILLDETEVQTALNNFVETMGIENATGVELIVEDDGSVSAEVQVGTSTTTATKPKPKSRGGRPAGSKNKPKPAETEEAPDAAEDDTEEDSNRADSGGSEQAEDDSEERTTKANPSKAEESQSSASDDSGKTEEAETPAEPVKPKKKSIFDED